MGAPLTPQKGGPNTPAAAATTSQALTTPQISFPKDPFWQDIYDYLIDNSVLRRNTVSDRFYGISADPGGISHPLANLKEIQKTEVIEMIRTLKSDLQSKYRVTTFAALGPDHLGVMKYWVYEAVKKL